MKSVFVLILLIISLAGNAGAEEAKTLPGKDLCLLDIKNCVGQSYYNIVEKIVRIKAALEVGSRVYSHQERQHLEYMYEEALFACDRIDCPPSLVPEMQDRL